MGYWDKKEPKQEVQEIDEVSLDQLEKDCTEEIGTIEKGFRERMAAENKRFADMCDTEYWCCICFKSRAQREEFLRSLDLPTDQKYLDGREVAKAMKRPVKTKDLEFARIKSSAPGYVDRAMN